LGILQSNSSFAQWDILPNYTLITDDTSSEKPVIATPTLHGEQSNGYKLITDDPIVREEEPITTAKEPITSAKEPITSAKESITTDKDVTDRPTQSDPSRLIYKETIKQELRDN